MKKLLLIALVASGFAFGSIVQFWRRLSDWELESPRRLLWILPLRVLWAMLLLSAIFILLYRPLIILLALGAEFITAITGIITTAIKLT
jgi:hypothetical protein